MLFFTSASLTTVLFSACLFTAGSALKNPKRGLAFANGKNPNDITKAITPASVISWVYDWSSTPLDTVAKSGLQYVPMQWGTSGIEKFASTVRSQGAKYVLGFNEPDLQGQSEISPTHAASLWKTYINPLADSGIRLGAPAVSSSPDGPRWLESFLQDCCDCKIDFIPIHWYGLGAENFLNYLQYIHGKFPNRPLWVTEYASTSSNSDEVADFLNVTMKSMDKLDWIERYAWFAFFREERNSWYNLLDPEGTPNKLGKIYFNQ